MRKKRDKEFRDAFSRISTGSLDSLLQEELEKSPADEKTIKMLLEELKRREEGESKKYMKINYKHGKMHKLQTTKKYELRTDF